MSSLPYMLAAKLPDTIDPAEIIAADTVVRLAGWDVRYTIHLYGMIDGVLVSVRPASLESVCAAMQMSMFSAEEEWHHTSYRSTRLVPFAVMLLSSGDAPGLLRHAHQVRFAITRLPPYTMIPRMVPVTAVPPEMLHKVPVVQQILPKLSLAQAAAVLWDQYRRSYMRAVFRPALGFPLGQPAGQLERASLQEAALYGVLFAGRDIAHVFDRRPRYQQAVYDGAMPRGVA